MPPHDTPLLQCLEREKHRDEQMERVNKKLDVILIAVTGDITTSQPGILTRLDRLERQEEVRSWFLRSLIGATLALMAERIWSWFHR